MRGLIRVGPLTAFVRECWVRADNLRESGEWPDWTCRPVLHAAAVGSVKIEEGRRNKGHLHAFLKALCDDPRYELVIVEGVQSPVPAEALTRWGWECDRGVMDFYRRK